MSIIPEITGRKFTSNNVCSRYAITRRTLGRWVVDPKMNFPQPVYLNGRMYFDGAELAEFDRRTLAAALLKREAA